MNPEYILDMMYIERERLLEDAETFEIRLRILRRGTNFKKIDECNRILSTIQRDIVEITRQIEFSERYLSERDYLGIR